MVNFLFNSFFLIFFSFWVLKLEHFTFLTQLLSTGVTMKIEKGHLLVCRNLLHSDDILIFILLESWIGFVLPFCLCMKYLVDLYSYAGLPILWWL